MHTDLPGYWSIYYYELIPAYSIGSEPYNLAQQSGAFEVHEINGSQVMAQVVLHPPIDTCRPNAIQGPVNIIGDHTW